MKKLKVIQIEVDETLQNRLNQAAEITGLLHAASIFRFILADFCQKKEEIKIRYGNKSLSEEERGARKPTSVLRAERQQTEIERIKKMNIDKLNTYLAGKGYLEPDKDLNNGYIQRNRVFEDREGTGVIWSYFYSIDKATGATMSFCQYETLDQIINKLIKQKKI